MNKLLLLTLLVFSSHLTYSQTKIIAHRGFSGMAPENTLIAFQKAIESGADYFELDLHKTKDDSLVVIHDFSIERTCSNNLSGKLSEMTYDELSLVKVGYSERFDDKYKNEKIPTLREVFALANNKIKIAIEIKIYGVEKEVLKIINDLNLQDDVIIFSFHYPVLAMIRELDKSIPTLFLKSSADSLSIEYTKLIEADAIGVGNGTVITQDFLDFAHDSNIEVWKWTIDDESKMKQLIEIGIDGLITNFPDRAIKIKNDR